MKPLNIAMLYAFWSGEKWSTPIGLKNELLRRGHNVTDWNLYHNNGTIVPNLKRRTYSIQGLMTLMQAIQSGVYKPDVLFHLDYGVFDHAALDKKYFDHNMWWLLEAGDTPQSFKNTTNKTRKFDCVITPDLPSTHLWNQYGIPAKWWPHFADHYVFKPYEDVNIEFDCVTTCGSRGNGLTDTVAKALGNRFNNERYFWGKDHARRLCMGKIIFQCSQFKEITRRIFEGMACRRMVLTDRLPEGTHIQDLFIEGRDIVYYNDAHDAIDKIKYYSEHDDERETIAENGYQKVLNAHTVQHRIDFIEEQYNQWKNLNTVNVSA